MRQYIVPALLYYVVCATILGCVHYYVACATLVSELVYCNIHKEVRLGGWGQTRKCVLYYIRLRALLYKIACATILGCVRYYIRLRASPLCMH